MNMQFRNNDQARAVADRILAAVGSGNWSEYASNEQELGFLLLGIKYAFEVNIAQVAEGHGIHEFHMQTAANLLANSLHDGPEDTPTSTAADTVADEGTGEDGAAPAVALPDDYDPLRRAVGETLQKLRPQWKAYMTRQPDDPDGAKSLSVCLRILGCLIVKGVSRRKLDRNEHALITGQGGIDGMGWFKR